MKTWLAVVFLAGWCVAGSGSGLAQDAAATSGKRPMTFTDLQTMKRVSDPQISPSGKWVMFSVTDVSLEKNTKITNLWVVPIGGGAERQLTFGEVSQTNGRFSPDGKWVSLTSAGGGTSQIWTAAWDEATGTMAKPHPLTNVSTEADGAIWSPDSKRLLFVSSVYPECSDKATWAEEDACNKARDKAAAKSPVKAMVFEHLLYRHWDAYTGEKRSHVLVVSAANGEDVRDLTPASAVGDAETPTFSLGGPIGYAWAPDSKEVAYVTNLDTVKAASTNNDVFMLRLDEPGAKSVKISTSPGSDDAPAYSPDGRWLAFRSQARAGFESDRFRLMLFDREKKTMKELMPKFDAWVDDFKWASPDYLYFAAGYHGEENLYGVYAGNATVPTELKDVDQQLKKLGAYGISHPGSSGLLAGGAEFGDFSIGSEMPMPGAVNLAPNFIVAVRMKVDAPAEIVKIHLCDCDTTMPLNELGVASANGSSVVELTHLNDGVMNQLDLPKMEAFWFAGANGTKVQGFIIRPPHFNPAKKYPLKFLMHGGPQTAWGDAWSYRWNPELFAADGYVVVMINRRGSTGYGQRFVDEVSGDWGGKAYVDLMKGLDYAEQHFPFIDKDRECALGASYGGYMADWVLTHTNRFKCIVTHDGMYNPQSAFGTTEELWFNEWEFRRPEDFPKGWDGFPGQGKGAGHPGQPWRYASLPAEQDPFRKWSPMLHIKDAKTPTLIIHSQHDYRLDVSQGFELFTALQRLGVPSKFLYFPDEGHWVLKPQNSQLWYETVNDWCDRWTHTNKYARAK